MKIRNEYTCPLELVHDIIKGKWKTIIIFQVWDGKCSFTNLKRGIVGISQKMLLEQLRELKYFKLIDKKVYKGFPLKVEYFLTKRGRKMLCAIMIMQELGIEYMVEYGMTEFLDKKGISYQDIHTKK